MKNEEILEILEKSKLNGVIERNGCIEVGICCTTIGDELVELINLVEQATLERAANHFEERCVFEMANGNHFAKEIRALKTENSV